MPPYRPSHFRLVPVWPRCCGPLDHISAGNTRMSLMNHSFSIFGHQRAGGLSCAPVIPGIYACVKAPSRWRSCALWLVGAQVAFSGVFVLVDPLEDPTLTGCRLHGDRTRTPRPCPSLDHDPSADARGGEGYRLVIVGLLSVGPRVQHASKLATSPNQVPGALVPSFWPVSELAVAFSHRFCRVVASRVQ